MVETLLSFSQATGIYTLMNSPWGWPIAESIHFIGLCLLIGTVGLFDLRMLGVAEEVSLRELHRLVPFGLLGYFLNVGTGLLFLTTAPDQYVYNPAVQTKLFFMLIAGINMLLFYATTAEHIKSHQPATGAIRRSKILGAVSLTCWLAVIVCGRLITYYRPPYHWCIWC